MVDAEVTYRLVALNNPDIAGRTASSIELARLVPGDVARCRSEKLGLERTDWGEHYGKPKVIRTVLIDAESHPGEWTLG